MSANNDNETSRANIIRSITTPLSFMALVVLVTEVYFGIVATTFNDEGRLYIVAGMFLLIALTVFAVVFLAYTRPEYLTGASQASPTDRLITEEASDEYDKVIRYFDSRKRKFLNDLRPWTIKGSGVQWREVMDIQGQEDYVKLWRKLREDRVVLTVRNYITPPNSPSNEYIPPDNSPDLIGEETVRYIFCEFYARVDKGEQKIRVRLRKLGKKPGTYPLFKGVRREITVSTRKWAPYQALLGPIRADQLCFVTLDWIRGSIGMDNALYIRNLIIEEWREKDE